MEASSPRRLRFSGAPCPPSLVDYPSLSSHADTQGSGHPRLPTPSLEGVTFGVLCTASRTQWLVGLFLEWGCSLMAALSDNPGSDVFSGLSFVGTRGIPLQRRCLLDRSLTLIDISAK